MGRLISFHSGDWKVLKPSKVTGGYLAYWLSKNNRQHAERAHRIVANHFIPNPKNAPVVDHINSIRDDNRSINLRWCTYKENTQFALRNNRFNPSIGGKHYRASLSKEDVLKIRELSKQISRKDLAKMYNVHYTTISNIINRERWKHI